MLLRRWLLDCASWAFRRADVHAVIAELRQQSALAAAAPQQWIREALLRLHSAPARSMRQPVPALMERSP
jgi:hypothetical protein